jgi:hypothetical protein
LIGQEQLPAGSDQPGIVEPVAVAHWASLVGGEDVPPAAAVAQLMFGDPPQRIPFHHRVHPAAAGV